MKYVSALLLIFLVGCSNTMLPTATSDDVDWEKYGMMAAESGEVKLSENEFAAQGIDDGATYMAYSSGYEAGRGQYCAQDAFSLGESRRYYRGICDDLNDRFRREYELGRTLKGSKRY
ncbi:DUF2799 domain-containing protein [Vibrio rotiferianus]|jgi:hypothetical protein|uniref:DUF2799 domain-containing protein n=1 Tax=Vibrio rotiferianus TaxID=190895 RepID=UPI00406A1D42